MRVAFMGTPEFALPTLAGVIEGGHEVVAVYTQPPRPAGRGMAERKSPVHVFAQARGLPVLTPRSLKGEPEQQAFAGHAADVAVVVAYGLILPKPVLDAPASRLPQPARLCPAALARRRTHPARHHGRRYRDGGLRHAHGRGAGHGPRVPARSASPSGPT